MHLKSGKAYNNCELLAYHGWGFGPEFWDPLKAVIPENCAFRTDNAGYFGKKKRVRFSLKPDKYRILIAHSFGLHRIPEKQIDGADLMVIINGFRSFIPEEDKELKKNSGIQLDRMIREFDEQPEQVLQLFRKKAFKPGVLPEVYKATPEIIHSGLLMDDLLAMKSSIIPPERFSKSRELRLIVIDSEQDRILDSGRGKYFCRIEGVPAVYHYIRGAGHAVAGSHASDCWSFLSAMIPIFRSNEYNRR